MKGQGPSGHQGGRVLKHYRRNAPLATDMVAATIMGFRPEEVSTFVWNWKAGMSPRSLDEIDLRGEKIEDVRRNLARPVVFQRPMMRNYGPLLNLCQYGEPDRMLIRESLP